MLKDQPISQLQSVESRVYIQDVLITGVMNTAPDGTWIAPLGEFGDMTADTKTQRERLYSHIEKLVPSAATIHRDQHCTADDPLKLKPGHGNHITRLVTNEFSFYTATPLSLEDFAQLQLQITEMAKKYPANLHLVLSSFAVKTSDNQVMNIVMQVACGPEPKVRYFAKSHPSPIDPSYSEVNKQGLKMPLPNVARKELKPAIYDPISQDLLEPAEYETHIPSAVLNGQPISFDNVYEGETAAGASYWAACDVCADTTNGTAQRTTNQKLGQATDSKKPVQSSHILTSNTIQTYPQYALGTITHADPYHFAKSGSKKISSYQIQPAFGQPLNVLVTNPMGCSPLPAAQMKLIAGEKHLANFIKQSLIDIGNYDGWDGEQKRQAAQDCIRDYIPHFQSIDELQQLFDEFAILCDQTNPAAQDYLTGFSPRCKYMFDLIKGRALELVNNQQDHPLFQALNSYQANFKLSTDIPSPSAFTPDIVEQLLNDNADLNAQNKYGQRPLEMAILDGELESVQKLLENGADPNLCNAGESPLVQAIKQQQHEIISALLLHGANPNQVDDNGLSPLAAAYHGNSPKKYEIMSELMRYGANPILTKINGQSLFELSAQDETLKNLLKDRARGVTIASILATGSYVVIDGKATISQTLRGVGKEIRDKFKSLRSGSSKSERASSSTESNTRKSILPMMTLNKEKSKRPPLPTFINTAPSATLPPAAPSPSPEDPSGKTKKHSQH